MTKAGCGDARFLAFFASRSAVPHRTATGTPDAGTSSQGDAADTGASSPGDTAADAGTFQVQPAAPLTVQPTLDPGHAATATIPATGGGSLQATGADGTRYTLTIPDGALLMDTDVTLTPVSTIAGLPFSGGLQAGVEISPHGTLLYSLGTLEIAPATAVTADRQVGFTYRGDGSELHLVPLTTTGLLFGVDAFAGYGDAIATAADVSAQELHPPTDPLAQLEQDIAQLFFAERPDAIEPDPPLPASPGLQQFLSMYYTSVVLPDYSLALHSRMPDAIEAEIQSEVAFDHQCMLVGDMTIAGMVTNLISNLAVQYSMLADADIAANCGTLTAAQLSDYGAASLMLTKLNGGVPYPFFNDLVSCNACQKSCPKGSMCCPGFVCQNTKSDPANCGACGNACPTGDTCTGGTCSGDLFCLYSANGTQTCQAFEGFVSATAYSQALTACQMNNDTILSACPTAPSGCCITNSATSHLYYLCYYFPASAAASDLALAMATCPASTGTWITGPTASQLPF
jgi:hypothetical protein